MHNLNAPSAVPSVGYELRGYYFGPTLLLGLLDTAMDTSSTKDPSAMEGGGDRLEVATVLYELVTY